MGRERIEQLKVPLRAIIDELAAKNAERARLSGRADGPDLAPVARPPATAAELDEYERYLGFPLPDSYRAFLELHNGYERLTTNYSTVLGTGDARPGGPWHAEITQWRRLMLRCGRDEIVDGVADGVVISFDGQPNDWTYLAPHRRVGDELAVVMIDPSDDYEFDDLLEWLQFWISIDDD